LENNEKNRETISLILRSIHDINFLRLFSCIYVHAKERENMITELRPMNWNDLPDIDDVEHMTEKDHQCLNEIKAVLDRYGRTRRFGITLLHSHFRLGDDEVFLEHSDEIARTLFSRPVKLSEIANKPFRPTVWRFDGVKAQGCSYCPTGEDKKHYGYKEPC